MILHLLNPVMPLYVNMGVSPGNKVDLEWEECYLSFPRCVLFFSGGCLCNFDRGRNVGSLLRQLAQLRVVQLHLDAALQVVWQQPKGYYFGTFKHVQTQ